MFQKKVLSITMAALLTASLTLTGCSTGSPAAASGAAGAASKASDGKFDLAVVSISPSDANNANYIKGLQAAAAKYNWTVSVTDAHGSADEANSAIQNFVTRGADAIIDMVFPTTSLATGLRAAKEAKIPVATWGGGMGDGVAVTNGTGGLFAVPIVKMMKEQIGDKGDILALTYHTGQVAREREAELDKVVANIPGIKVTKNEVKIPGTLQDGAQYANAWLASHPQGSGKLAIWGSWDDPALGAISSLKQQGRKDVLVYGQNGNADAIKAIQDGWMTATAWEDAAAEAAKAVETLKQAIAAGDSWKPVAAEVAPVIITKDNVAQFIKDHPDAIK